MSGLKNRGRFISLEGGEGVGKSTQLQRLAMKLREHGIEVVVTREPGGSRGAEAIRELLLAGRVERWSAATEALLFAAARSDHVAHTITPALDSGKWVISDRFVDSSRAYQGVAGGLGDEAVMQLHASGSAGLLPDRTIVLAFDDTKGRERARARDGGSGDRFEQKSDQYHLAINQAWKRFCALEPDRIRLVDASGSEDEVTARIWAELADLTA